MSACRSCQAEIMWCETIMGQRIPIDLHPSPHGNIRVLVDVAGVRRAVLMGATLDLLDPDDDGIRYQSHFVSCPDSNEWRKR